MTASISTPFEQALTKPHEYKWHIRKCPDCYESFSSRSYKDFVRCPTCANRVKRERTEEENRIRKLLREEGGEHRVYPWLIVYDPLDNCEGGMELRRFTGEEIMLMLQPHVLGGCSLMGCKIRQLNGSDTIYCVADDGTLTNGRGERYKLNARFYLERK